MSVKIRVSMLLNSDKNSLSNHVLALQINQVRTMKIKHISMKRRVGFRRQVVVIELKSFFPNFCSLTPLTIEIFKILLVKTGENEFRCKRYFIF